MADGTVFRGPNQPQPKGTIIDWNNFDPQHDCESIRKAGEKFISDGATICNIICKRSNRQRQQLKKIFKAMFGKDLEEQVEKALRGNNEDLVLALLKPPAEFDAQEIRKAIEGMGTDETVLIDILCTASNDHIEAVKKAYAEVFKRDIEKDVIGDTSYSFKKILVSVLAGARDESVQVNHQTVQEDAQKLYQAGEGKVGTDEEKFNMILAIRSYVHLRAVFDEYQRIANNDLEKAIRSEFSGDIRNALLAIVKCAKNPAKYFAEVLHDSMKGLGTDDARLIRTMVDRSEHDMEDIKTEFQKMYGKTLTNWIVEDTSGKYKDTLVLIVNGNRQ